jgi:hypothetical protein
MPTMNSAIKALQSHLTASTVYTPDSEKYRDSLIRWSDTGVKDAVGDTISG